MTNIFVDPWMLVVIVLTVCIYYGLGWFAGAVSKTYTEHEKTK